MVIQTTSRHNGKMWGAIMEAWHQVENSYPLELACWLRRVTICFKSGDWDGGIFLMENEWEMLLWS